MSILAIDTATQVSSVAVASADKLAAELTMQAKLTHSETLMPHIKEVLRMANVRKEQLEGIAQQVVDRAIASQVMTSSHGDEGKVISFHHTLCHEIVKLAGNFAL